MDGQLRNLHGRGAGQHVEDGLRHVRGLEDVVGVLHVLQGLRGRHLRADATRADARDADLEALHHLRVVAEALAEGGDAVLRGAVRRHRVGRDVDRPVAGDAVDVDDVPVLGAVLLHALQRLAAAQHHRREVRVHQLLYRGRVGILQRDEGEDGGVVDDDGDAAEVVFDPLVHPAHFLRPGQVRRQRVQLALLAGQLGGELLQALLPAGHADHRDAGAHEQLGDHGADARADPCHQGDAACEAIHC